MPVSNNPNSPSPEAPKPKSSGFVNLGRILGANINNKLASTVNQGIQKGAQSVGQNLQQIGGQFQQQAGAANLASDVNKQARDQALMNIGAGNTNVTPQQQEQFEQFRSGQYAGPKELDPSKTAQISAKALELQSQGQSLKGGKDKSGVLQAYVGKGPNYTQGQQKLDSLLLGKGPNAQQELGQAKKATQGLSQEVQKQQDIARNVGEQRIGQAQQFGQDTRNQLQNASGQIGTDVQNRLTEAQKGQQFMSGIQNKLASGQNLTPEEIQQLNLPSSTQGQLSGVNLDTNTILRNLNALQGALPGNRADQFFNIQNPTTSSVASQQELAKLQALSQLSGQPQELIAQPEQVGQYTNPSFDYNNFINNSTLNQRLSGKSDLQPGTPGYGQELDTVNNVRRVFGLPPLTALNPMVAPGGAGSGNVGGGIRLAF